MLEGVVPDSRLFLGPVHHQDGRVHVEDEPRWRARLDGQPLQEPIVQRPEFGQTTWRGTQQEAPEAGRIGIARQPSQRLKEAIPAKPLCGFEPLKAEHHRVEQSPEHLADAVASVPLRQPNLNRHRVLEADPREKSMQERDAAVMRHVRSPECDGEMSRSPWHRSQPYLEGSFRCNDPKCHTTRRENARASEGSPVHAGFRFKQIFPIRCERWIVGVSMERAVRVLGKG